MSFPTCNPIDYGWFSRGVPIDHMGSISSRCLVCDDTTMHEKFRILVGSIAGIGAPFFAKPFMKRSSTSGKLGGTKGEVVMCTKCSSLWPYDSAGADALARAGIPREGLIAISKQAEYRDRLARMTEEKRKGSEDQSTPDGQSVVKKSYD